MNPTETAAAESPSMIVGRTQNDGAHAHSMNAVKPKSGSSTTADRAKSLNDFRISTASQFTLRVITDFFTIACGLTT
jgi:hypothetical protein